VAVLTRGLAPRLPALAARRTARAAPILPAAAAARILALGHRLEAGAPSAEFVARLARTLELAQRFSAADIGLLGGARRPGAPSEAETGRAQLVARGVAPERITTRTRSRHTLEHLRNHRDLAIPGGPEALVTSRPHLHRALRMARGLCLSLLPVAAEDRPRADPLRLCAEGFLLHGYLTGRALARLLPRRRWLARIGQG